VHTQGLMLQIYIYMHVVEYRLQNYIAMQNKRFSFTIIVIWKCGTKYTAIIKINIAFYYINRNKITLKDLMCNFAPFSPRIYH